PISVRTSSRSRSFRPVFLFNDTAPPAIYTLSLHDALPISATPTTASSSTGATSATPRAATASPTARPSSTGPTRSACATSSRWRSEEHTSELQSRENLVCRLLLEKKKETTPNEESTRRNNK